MTGATLQGKLAAQRVFQALPPFMQQMRIDVNSATAAAIAVGAKQRVVASPSVQTRSLLNHINWRVSTRSGVAYVGVSSGSTSIAVNGKKVRVKGIVVAGRGGSALRSKGATIIRPSRYAHLIEFGTVHAPAEPFMLPSVAHQRSAHLQRWQMAGRRLEREMAGLGANTISTGGGLL